MVKGGVRLAGVEEPLSQARFIGIKVPIQRVLVDKYQPELLYFKNTQAHVVYITIHPNGVLLICLYNSKFDLIPDGESIPFYTQEQAEELYPWLFDKAESDH